MMLLGKVVGNLSPLLGMVQSSPIYFFANDIVLFAEASVVQMSIIKKCLDKFCLWSGQKVSFEKSHLLFSTNVSPLLANQISEVANIPYTDDLGFYLGMPSINGRVSKVTFQYILDRVKKKLTG